MSEDNLSIKLRVCVYVRVHGHTVLVIHSVLTAMGEVLVRVPSDQRVLGVVVHRDAWPILQVAQT